ncbi:hypothetical protein D3C77_328160 [compost metagenome]
MPSIMRRICAISAGSSTIQRSRNFTRRSPRAINFSNSCSFRSASPIEMRQSKFRIASSPNSDLLPPRCLDPSSDCTAARSRGFLRLAASHHAGSNTCQPASSSRRLSEFRNRQAASSSSDLPSTSSPRDSCSLGRMACSRFSQLAERLRMASDHASGHLPVTEPSSPSRTFWSVAGSLLSCRTRCSRQRGY